MKTALFGNQSPVTRLIFAILLIISSFLVTFILGVLLAIPIFNVDLFNSFAAISDYSNPLTIALLKYLQIIQSFGLFILPPILAGYFFEKNSIGYLKINQSSKPLIYFLVLVVMFAALPLINGMVSFNEEMRLPEFFKGIENWMRSTEDEAARLTEAFMKVNSAGGFVINMIMIAILPAIGEEFLFRGLLQRLFNEWIKNIHIAIFIAAFLFGAMHLQFYGILPRMMLGVLFGYLFYWSGSIWIPVFAHFVNNASAVIISYLATRGLISGGYEDFGATDNLFLIAGSFVFTGVLLILVYRIGRDRHHG